MKDVLTSIYFSVRVTGAKFELTFGKCTLYTDHQYITQRQTTAYTHTVHSDTYKQFNESDLLEKPTQAPGQHVNSTQKGLSQR